MNVWMTNQSRVAYLRQFLLIQCHLRLRISGFFIQAKRNVHPMFSKWLDDYVDYGINFTKRFDEFLCLPGLESDCPPYRSFNESCPLSSLCHPVTMWSDGLFTKGLQADITHKVIEYGSSLERCSLWAPRSSHLNALLNIAMPAESQIFLEQPKRFIKSVQQGERFVPVKQRISINMFAMHFGLARTVLGTFISSYCCDDEGFMAKWPTISKSPHLIDTKLTVAHFAFGPQYLGTGMGIFRSLGLYDNLALRTANRSMLETYSSY